MGKRERRTGETPVISDLFPISEKAIGVAFTEIFPKFLMGNTEVDEALGMIEAENPSLHTWICARGRACLKQEYDDNPQILMSSYAIGVVTAYSMLSSEAKKKGGALPKIAGEIVSLFIQDHFTPDPGSSSMPRIDLSESGELSQEQFEEIERTMNKNHTQGISDLCKNEPYINSYLGFLLTYLKPEVFEFFVTGFFEVYSLFRTHKEVEGLRSQIQ